MSIDLDKTYDVVFIVGGPVGTRLVPDGPDRYVTRAGDGTQGSAPGMLSRTVAAG